MEASMPPSPHLFDEAPGGACAAVTVPLNPPVNVRLALYARTGAVGVGEAAAEGDAVACAGFGEEAALEAAPQPAAKTAAMQISVVIHGVAFPFSACFMPPGWVQVGIGGSLSPVSNQSQNVDEGQCAPVRTPSCRSQRR